MDMKGLADNQGKDNEQQEDGKSCNTPPNREITQALPP
jgi:hypothetical protein